MKKQLIKESEAKIIVFLENTPPNLHYAGAISTKLQKDYGYLLRILKEMNEKGWLRKDSQALKTYYFLTKVAPLENAKEMLIK